MYLAVKKVTPFADYWLQLTFENGEQRRFDMTPYLDTGIFRELKDRSLFETVHLGFDTVEWNNEADLDSEVLYRESSPI